MARPAAFRLSPLEQAWGDSSPVSSESRVAAEPGAEPDGPAPELARPLPTYIGPEIKVKGTITAAEDVHIEGFVEGSVSVRGNRLTVGEMAYIDAEASAREVVVFGAVQGDVSASDRIEIKKRASVAGDLATSEIVIEEGAHFKGRIEVLGTKL